MNRITLIADKDLAMKSWTKEQCAYGLVSSNKVIVSIAKEVIKTNYKNVELEIEQMAYNIVAEETKWQHV